MRSVFNARTPDLRYTIWDGKGTDGSCEEAARLWGGDLEIHKAEDSGQYNALKKGFERMSGGIMGWINAGDILFPWTLKAVAEIFRQFPEVEWIYGRPCAGSDGVVRRVGPFKPIPRDVLRLGLCNADGIGFLAQEAMFWRRSLYERAGGISDKFELVADFDLWTRFAKFTDLVSCTIPLAMFAQHGDNRSQSLKAKAGQELIDWQRSLSDESQNARQKLATEFRLVRKSRALGSFLSRVFFRLLQLNRLQGHILEWNSRQDTSALRTARLSADHLS